eukprot:scaffold13016_cov95-Skeletonema_marinoi.AAC.2
MRDEKQDVASGVRCSQVEVVLCKVIKALCVGTNTKEFPNCCLFVIINAGIIRGLHQLLATY